MLITALYIPPNANVSMQEHQVRKILGGLKPHKAAGPDGVLSKVLEPCTDQFSGVPDKDLQHLPETGHHSVLSENSDHRSDPQEELYKLPK